MHLDVQDLKNFYYRQSLGRAVQRVVRKEVVRHWPDTTGQTVVGFGFAVPSTASVSGKITTCDRVNARATGGHALASGCAECFRYHR